MTQSIKANLLVLGLNFFWVQIRPLHTYLHTYIQQAHNRQTILDSVMFSSSLHRIALTLFVFIGPELNKMRF